MRTFAVLLLLAMSAPAAQFPSNDNPEQPPPGKDVPLRLPNGKLQQDAIAKEDFQKNLADSRDLAKLAEDLKSELEKSDASIVSLSAIKKTEEIEKLAKRIRGRMKH
ncbi:MAG: hypothetical protein ACRD4P_09905 [Bryobacteraceae bacterium]